MSAEIKIHQRFEAFSREFLLPLLSGERVTTGSALTPGMLSHFALAVGSEGPSAHDLICDLAADLYPLRRLRWPERGAVAVAMALHNLTLLTDPEVASWPTRRAKAKVRNWILWFLEEAGYPQTRDEALCRHAIVSTAMQMRRKDITVRNWALSETYEGRDVPGRMLKWPTIRRISTRESFTDVLQLWESEAPEAAAAIRIASPVTQLVVPAPFSFGPMHAAVLSDGRLRGAISRKIARDGGTAEVVEAALAQLAEDSGAHPTTLYFVLRLIYEVQVTRILDRGRQSTQAGLLEAVLVAMLEHWPAARDLRLDQDDARTVSKTAFRFRDRVDSVELDVARTLVQRAAAPKKLESGAGPLADLTHMRHP